MTTEITSTVLCVNLSPEGKENKVEKSFPHNFSLVIIYIINNIDGTHICYHEHKKEGKTRENCIIFVTRARSWWTVLRFDF